LPQQESLTRENAFYNKQGSDTNIDRVVYGASVPNSSQGFVYKKSGERVGENETHSFFRSLGDARNPAWGSDPQKKEQNENHSSEELAARMRAGNPAALSGLRRRAEQEYILQNMVKGALWDAARIAGEWKLSIAVRGTSTLAHMGIEAGQPVKAQEFKNKTSKIEDFVLCKEMTWDQIGAVVHYDPRPSWTSAQGSSFRSSRQAATEADWAQAQAQVQQRLNDLTARRQAPSDGALKWPTMDKLKSTFLARSREYFEEDYAYRRGKYAAQTSLEGPYIRLKLRPTANMVGDHDLFAFTDDQGNILKDPIHDARVDGAQRALQRSDAFQAQHGGIWYWKPDSEFNESIKTKIMSAHNAAGNEPLLLISAEKVQAAFFVEPQKIDSVWNNPSSRAWLATTHSGRLVP
jgi:hypothetical protein